MVEGANAEEAAAWELEGRRSGEPHDSPTSPSPDSGPVSSSASALEPALLSGELVF